MTIPLEPYRVIVPTDDPKEAWDALREAFIDRVEDMNVPRGEIDAAGGFTAGHASHILCSPPLKDLGPKSLGKMLKGTGLALVLVVDDERFAPIRAQMATRKRKVLPSIVGQRKPKWLFTSKKAREMRAKWWNSLTPAQQKKHQRKAQKAQARARRRRKAKKPGTLLAQVRLPSSCDGKVASQREC